MCPATAVSVPLYPQTLALEDAWAQRSHQRLWVAGLEGPHSISAQPWDVLQKQFLKHLLELEALRPRRGGQGTERGQNFL